MFVSRRRKLTLGALIATGVLAVVALALPTGGSSGDAEIFVAPGYLAVPIKINDAAITRVLAEGDRVDVMATRQIDDDEPSVRQLATNVRVIATLEPEINRVASARELSTLIVEASPTAAVAIAGAVNDTISVAILPK